MDVSQILIPFLVRLPLFLLWLVGIGIAVFRWRVHPRVSISVIVGLIILSITAGISFLFSVVFPQLVQSYVENRLLINFILFMQRVVPLLDLAGWVLVLFAIFSGRRVAESVST